MSVTTDAVPTCGFDTEVQKLACSVVALATAVHKFWGGASEGRGVIVCVNISRHFFRVDESIFNGMHHKQTDFKKLLRW